MGWVGQGCLMRVADKDGASRRVSGAQASHLLGRRLEVVDAHVRAQTPRDQLVPGPRQQAVRTKTHALNLRRHIRSRAFHHHPSAALTPCLLPLSLFPCLPASPLPPISYIHLPIYHGSFNKGTDLRATGSGPGSSCPGERPRACQHYSAKSPPDTEMQLRGTTLPCRQLVWSSLRSASGSRTTPWVFSREGRCSRRSPHGQCSRRCRQRGKSSRRCDQHEWSKGQSFGGTRVGQELTAAIFFIPGCENRRGSNTE